MASFGEQRAPSVVSSPSGAIVTFGSNSRCVEANEPETLTKFYSGLFGWKFQKAEVPGPEYWLCDTGSGGKGINGAVAQRQNPQHPWMNYVDVESIDAAIEQATKLGAKVAMPKMPVPGIGAVAAIIDPEGNICGLWQQAART